MHGHLPTNFRYPYEIQSYTAVPAVLATSPHQLSPWAPANLAHGLDTPLKLLLSLSINTSFGPIRGLSPARGTVDSSLSTGRSAVLASVHPTLVIFLRHGSPLFSWHQAPQPTLRSSAPADKVLEVLFSSLTVPCKDHGFIYVSVFITLYSPSPLLEQLIGLFPYHIYIIASIIFFSVPLKAW